MLTINFYNTAIMKLEKLSASKTLRLIKETDPGSRLFSLSIELYVSQLTVLHSILLLANHPIIGTILVLLFVWPGLSLLAVRFFVVATDTIPVVLPQSEALTSY